MTTQVDIGYHRGKAVIIPNSCKGCGMCCHLNIMIGWKNHEYSPHWEGEPVNHELNFFGPGTTIMTKQFPKACRHLTEDRECAIYKERPVACQGCLRGSDTCLKALANVKIQMERYGPDLASTSCQSRGLHAGDSNATHR